MEMHTQRMVSVCLGIALPLDSELFAARGCDFAFGFPSSRRGLANDSGTVNS